MLRVSTSRRLTSSCRCISQFTYIIGEVETISKPNVEFEPNDRAIKKEETKPEPSVPFKNMFQVVTPVSPRFNDFNIQLISQAMCEHLFGKKLKIKQRNMQEVSKAIMELQKHGLMSTPNKVPELSINLPKLKGETIVDHFYNIGEEQCAPYRDLTLSLLEGLPTVPNSWEMVPGWTRYSEEGSIQVDFPEENALVFDVEVCCSAGQMPTLAIAASKKAWYSWVSEDLINGSNTENGTKNLYSMDKLIPLESNLNHRGFGLSKSLKTPRIVVGHNVSYDRARVKEQYWIEKTGLRFLDTMSLHVSVSGVTSYQKNLLKAGLGKEDEWSNLSSLNSLSKVHNLYCGSELSKEDRDIFIRGTLSDVSSNFQSLMSYCAKDVSATHNILCKLFPLYLSRFPHPVSLSGILELGLAYLPVNSNWNQYIKDCNETYIDLENEAKCILSNLADNACHFLHNEQYRKHLWLWDQDWSVRNLSLNKAKPIAKRKNVKPIINKFNLNNSLVEEDVCEDKKIQLLMEKFKYLIDMKSLLPVRAPHMPGYPAWYTKLCPKLSSLEWSPGPQLLSTGMQIAPKLLSLTWKSMPLHYVRGHGWGMLVPFKTDIDIDEAKVPLKELVQHCLNNNSQIFCDCHRLDSTSGNEIKFVCDKRNLNRNREKESVVHCKCDIGTGCGFIKLPHKDGKHLNVGNPLARDYIHKFSDGGLGGGNLKTKRLIEISRMLSYWRNNRERIENQITLWLQKKDVPKFMASDAKQVGAILPLVIVCGTLTRRAVEPTWMTASNALGERVGSELRSMITAPPTYCLVGADVDSQELWIASVIGDAHSYKEHGATPFGWMTLNGQKSDNTDMHSLTAKAVGISRHQAKVINYARIYGAGQLFAEHLLKQFNPEMSQSDARYKASKMFSMTKGKRCYMLKKDVLESMAQRIYTKYSARELCSLHGKSIEELFDKPKWIGGTESAMFNSLEEIASTHEPKTPFLKGRLSRALEPGADTEDKFNSTRINWVVQSGAVDFLHLMLVCMRWLMGPEVRFCLSFHDEVRYLVPKSQCYQAALALHVTNLYTRAFCISQLGMTDMPRSIAFFSSVEVDTVLRKESNNDCKTPSNPFGLSKGYCVPSGESLNIDDALKKARGTVGIPSYRRNRNDSSGSQS